MREKIKINFPLHRLEIKDDYRTMWVEEELVDYPCTLRDIARIMEVVMSGVNWSLACEISKRTGFSYDEIVLAMDDIIDEYSKLSEKEGMDRFFNNPKPSQEYFEHSLALFYERDARKEWDKIKE